VGAGVFKKGEADHVFVCCGVQIERSVIHISRRDPAVYKQEVTMEQTLKRIEIVRDVLIDCAGCQGDAEALEGLVKETEEALTNILNNREPYAIIGR
jgi:hypothetical protein